MLEVLDAKFDNKNKAESEPGSVTCASCSCIPIYSSPPQFQSQNGLKQEGIIRLITRFDLSQHKFNFARIEKSQRLKLRDGIRQQRRRHQRAHSEEDLRQGRRRRQR